MQRSEQQSDFFENPFVKEIFNIQYEPKNRNKLKIQNKKYEK